MEKTKKRGQRALALLLALLLVAGFIPQTAFASEGETTMTIGPVSRNVSSDGDGVSISVTSSVGGTVYVTP